MRNYAEDLQTSLKISRPKIRVKDVKTNKLGSNPLIFAKIYLLHLNLPLEEINIGFKVGFFEGICSKELLSSSFHILNIAKEKYKIIFSLQSKYAVRTFLKCKFNYHYSMRFPLISYYV